MIPNDLSHGRCNHLGDTDTTPDRLELENFRGRDRDFGADIVRTGALDRAHWHGTIFVAFRPGTAVGFAKMGQRNGIESQCCVFSALCMGNAKKSMVREKKHRTMFLFFR
jgi:hypothetical protein